MSYPDLAIPMRTAVLAVAAITAKLTAYQSSYPVFTRRPVAPGAPYPMIIVSPDISKSDQDGIDDQRPIIVRDVTVYGKNDTPDKYRDVELIGRELHDLFHRQRGAISVSGWGVVTITATGPIPAPVDDDQTVARMVSVTIQLAKQN